MFDVHLAGYGPPVRPTLQMHLNFVPEPVRLQETNGYVLYQDAVPEGEFLGFAGADFGGMLQITIPLPAGDRYYLIAGQNECGFGPKK